MTAEYVPHAFEVKLGKEARLGQIVMLKMRAPGSELLVALRNAEACERLGAMLLRAAQAMRTGEAPGLVTATPSDVKKIAERRAATAKMRRAQPGRKGKKP